MSDPTAIRLRPADPRPDSDDSRLAWQWRNDLQTRAMSRSGAEISWPEHVVWYERVAGDSNRTLLIAEHDSASLGVVRFDSSGADVAEISLNLAPELRGRRFAGPLLAIACQYGFEILCLERIDAEIKSENAASIRVFEAAGFELIREDRGLRKYMLCRSVQS